MNKKHCHTKRCRVLSLLMAMILLLCMTACGKTGVDREQFKSPDDRYGMLKLIHNMQNLYGEDKFTSFLDSTLIPKGYAGVVTNYPLGGSYLTGDRGWEIFREQLGWLKERGVRYWIYDEHGYPSGGADGLTLKEHPEYEAMGLVRVTAVSADGRISIPLPATHHIPFAAYACPGSSDGDKDVSRRVDISASIDSKTGAVEWKCPDDQVWFAETYGTKPLYDDTHAEGNAHQDRRYINIIDKEAVARFIDITYQQYYDRLGEELFGGIEAFFTDEPSLIHMYLGDFGANVPVIDQPDPEFVRWPTLAWSRSFLDDFVSRTGYDLYGHLPALFYGADEESARVRYDYWTVLSQLVAENYYGQIGKWCEEHGVKLSGHQLAEEVLNQQVICEGDFFANYSHMTYPGIDILTAQPEQLFRQAMTPKIASSAAHLYGYDGIMSESSEYNLKDASGNLTLSIQEVRCSLAMQYALGVKQITSYFAYNDLSPKDEEQGDITGTLLKRLGQTIDGGAHVADVAVYYPKETLFAELLPTTDNWNEPRSPRVGETTDSFQNAFFSLLRGQVDLDILPAEAIIHAQTGDGTLSIPEGESYRVLVIPTVSMLPAGFVESLRALADSGVKLIFLPQKELTTPRGGNTQLVKTLWEGVQAHENAVCIDAAVRLPETVRELLGTADLTFTPEGDLSAAVVNGGTELLYGHWSFESGERYLLTHPTDGELKAAVTFRAQGAVNKLDPLTGEIIPLKGTGNEDGTTTLSLTFAPYDYYFVEFAK